MAEQERRRTPSRGRDPRQRGPVKKRAVPGRKPQGQGPQGEQNPPRRAPKAAQTPPRRVPGQRRNPLRQGRRKKPSVVPEVVYLPPKPFERRKLILRLVTAGAAAVAVLLAVSLFFRVENVTVSGNVAYPAWDVAEASGIAKGDHLLTLNRAKAVGSIYDSLKYVKSARIGINLPNTVNIVIEETAVGYGVPDAQGNLWLVSAEGRVLERGTEESPQIKGIRIETPQAGQMAVALEEEAGDTPQTQTAAQKWAVLLTILSNLERNGFVGTVTTVDVTEPGQLLLSYENRYTVKLGNEERLDYKIACLKPAIEKMTAYQTGTFDVSFTTFPDEVGFTHE